MTIPAGSNGDNTTPHAGLGWRFTPGHHRDSQGASRRILFVESYGAGSHLRVARLFQRYSRHRIDIVRLERDHWRTLAFTGHRIIADAMRSLQPQNYDLILFSGPADIRLVLLNFPGGKPPAPVVTYMHESQWTYPSDATDRIPHLINHLETVELCDAVWFNSRFHLNTFHDSAMNHPSPTIRSLATDILPVHRKKARVIYPPVHVAVRKIHRSGPFTISWSARWEAEKRPDLMIAVVRTCLDSGLDLTLHILGCREEQWTTHPALDDNVRSIIHPESGFLERNEYEAVLAKSDVWLSTTEHEYFGVSAIEAAILGATPVVPAGLAYPETLPSALMYPPGDTVAAANCVRPVASAESPFSGAWRVDALRFRNDAAITKFDDTVLDVVCHSSA